MKKEPSPGARDRAPTLRRAMTEAERRLWQMPSGPRWCETRQTTPIPYRRGVVIGPFGIVCIAAGAHHRRGVPPSKLTGAR